MWRFENMKTDILNTLYNEVCSIRNAITNNDNYYFTILPDADGLEYLVILDNNTVFYISVGTDVLPDFDKNNVLYIRKKIEGLKFIDTEVGYFETDDQLSHGYEMEKKFNAKYDFDTHCYDCHCDTENKESNTLTVLDTLKTDLNFAKSIIETKSVYDVEYLDFNSEEKNGFQFHVILKDGSFFYIVLGSTIFPDIDFNDIVYIKKVRCFDYSEKDAKYQCCDTLIGNFNCNDVEEYEKTIYEKFNLKYDDEIETGGYD